MPLFNAGLFNEAQFGGGGIPPRVVEVGQGLLYPALRKAGITLGPQRTPSPAQFQDAIDELNRLTGSLNCDRLFIYSIARDEYPLDPPKMTYTIGIPPDPAEVVDFVSQRPQLIESANIVDTTGTIRYPLALFTSLQWTRVTYQTIPNTIPTAIYNDRAHPVSTLYLWGQPQSGQTLELFTWTQVPTFQNLTDQVMLPLQYEDTLVLNLAVRLVSQFPLAPNVPRQVDPNLYQQARESLMRLESINAPQPVADTSALCSGSGSGYNRWNIYSDQYRR
jgi:hypothetical protein